MTLSNLSDRGTLRGTLQRNSGNYNDLINKPAINGHTLIGNQSGHALGLANEDDIINVEANPLGPATADLHKILVDDTIYSIPDVVVYGTASGAIASFDDGGDNKSLKSLKVAINPVQDLHGYDAPWVGGAGKNKFDISKVVTSAEVVNNGETLSITTNSQTNNATAGNPNKLKDYCPTLKDGDVVTFSFTSTAERKYIYLLGTGANITWNSGTSQTITQAMLNATVLWYATATTGGTATISKIQFEIGSTTTTFAPYSNICPISGWNEAEIHRADGATPHIIDDTHNITWSEAGEVFGGTLDVTNGKLKARPYYASYNGETLIGPWISSMDVYDPNTPPTTGAQVVDLGGVETEIDISPTQITTLLGNNNIWSDTGEIEECVYQRDINIALNKALSQ